MLFSEESAPYQNVCQYSSNKYQLVTSLSFIALSSEKFIEKRKFHNHFSFALSV